MPLPWLLIVMTISVDPLEPGLHEQQLTVDDREREYLIYVPQGDSPRAGFPLVLAFHGGGSNARVMVNFCGLNETADEHRFAVAYPNGTGRIARARTFNGGNCCGYAQRQNVDDVAFTRAVIDDAKQRVSIDATRIYATGMSNGALMAYRVADEMADTIAAIAPVAGPMGTETCCPSRPVPVCHFHGTEDEFAAYDGGPGKRSLTRTHFYSVEHSLARWVEANNCQPEAIKTKLDSKVDDGTSITRYEYRTTSGEPLVVHYKVEGGGHTWPGRDPHVQFLGKSTKNLDANETMWAYFKRHSRK